MAIKFGVNTWTWVSPFKTSDTHLFSKIKHMGFDVVELAVEDPTLIDGRTVAARLWDLGLGATVCGAFGPSRDLSSDDSARVDESLEYIRACLRLCQQVGCSVFAGPMYSSVGKARQLPRDERKREWDRAVANLKRAATLADDHGVVLGLEPLNRFEIDMVNTHQQALSMMKAVGRKNVQIHLDTFHMNIEEKCVQTAIKACKGRLCHIHACENDRGTPGSGQVNWQGFARGLKAAKYDGAVVIETFTPLVKEIAKAAAIWRPLASSQDALARDGVKFLKKLLK